MLKIKVDVKLLDKSAFFQGKPNAKGHAPLYVDLVIHDNRDGVDQYGNDCYVKQDLGAARRQAGEKSPIIGNGRHLAPKGQQQPPPTPPPAQQNGPDDDIPF
jgi:hypothetical protein